MKINIFKSVRDTTPEGVITVDQFVAAVKSGRWAEPIDAVRRAKAAKDTLPCVTISGTFHPTRAESNLHEHSGFICIDIDGDNDMAALRNDPYMYAAFLSASGRGIAAIMRIDPSKHKESYAWAQRYFFDTHGKTIDPAPKNPASARYVSHDPNAHFNASATICPNAVKVQKINTAPYIGDADDALGRVVNAVQRNGINFAPDYDTYLRVAMALASHGGESARPTFHELIRNSEKYNYDQANRQYNICLKEGRGEVGIGTIFYLAKKHGIDYYPNLNSTPNPQVPAIEVPKDIQGNGVVAEICRYIQSAHRLQRNTITRQLEIDGEPASKEIINSIYLSCKLQWEKATKTDIEAFLFSAHVPQINPFLAFLSKPYMHDGSALDAYVNTIDSSTPDAKNFIRKWLISIGASIDGKVVRTMLALVGQKNHTGKTEWFRRILPPELKGYFGEDSLTRGKDSEIMMAQKLILLNDEMGSKTIQDEKRFKELASKDTFSLREPYGRHTVDLKRIAVLCGTSNDFQIINDPTGNSRVLPIEINYIDNNSVNAIDKTALFHDIWSAYKGGEEYRLTQQERDSLNELSEQFSEANIEAELVGLLIVDGGFMTTTDVKVWLEQQTGQRALSTRRIGIALRKAFERVKSKGVWGYKCARNM
ncbi:MAG: hypothetical protein GC193_13215 [Cryomorphaceae bacterium]|nr:hypothetical protein [Cryomorphaceae bacterium]